jgi:phage tail sheath protein FI
MAAFTYPGVYIEELSRGQHTITGLTWIQAPDPLDGSRPALFPSCGFVAGIYSATDASGGVGKAPAGINTAFTGNTGRQYVLTDAENGTLNPQAVNCLRQFKVYGDMAWGGAHFGRK